MEKVIHCELCKGLKYDHTTKWNMHQPESIPANEIYQILWDFKLQMNYPTPIRRLNLVLKLSIKKYS